MSAAPVLPDDLGAFATPLDVDGVTIRPLTSGDLDAFVTHCIAIVGESGRDGSPLFAPYPRSEPYPARSVRDVAPARWARGLDVPRWGRAWGVFDAGHLVGDAELRGGDLVTLLHRATLGMGLRKSHCGRGLGRLLLEHLVAFARSRPEIDWIDLGVFGGNAPARALYASLGFVEIGRADDRFRIDGERVTDISMALWVGQDG